MNGDEDLRVAVEIAKAIGNLGAFGVVAWVVYHVFTSTIPGLVDALNRNTEAMIQIKESLLAHDTRSQEFMIRSQAFMEKHMRNMIKESGKSD